MKVIGERTPLPCGHNEINERIGIEYPYDHPEHYDGVSVWKCKVCGKCWDAFTSEEIIEELDK